MSRPDGFSSKNVVLVRDMPRTISAWIRWLDHMPLTSNSAHAAIRRAIEKTVIHIRMFNVNSAVPLESWPEYHRKTIGDTDAAIIVAVVSGRSIRNTGKDRNILQLRANSPVGRSSDS